jgi:small subunit ribosomal protein S2
MPQIPELLELLKAGLHFGHQSSRWHPKMAPFIFTVRNGIHIINLEKTNEKLVEAFNFIQEIIKKDGLILFLGTKPQAQEIIKEAALAVVMPYVTSRWIGGTLTNFSQIKKLIEKYNNLKIQEESGELSKYTKKEQSLFNKEIKHLEEMVGGIANLKKLPDAIFIVDVKHESTAVAEAMKKKVPSIAICDTNSNPELITYPIPANDDGVKSIELIVGLVVEAIKEGKASTKIEKELDKKEIKKEEEKEKKEEKKD